MSDATDHELEDLNPENGPRESIAVAAAKWLPVEPARPPEIELHGTPEARTKLWSELAQAKAEFGKILKATPGQKGQQTFKYANLAAIFEATDSPLADHGICLTLIPTNEPGNATTCYTTILSGHGAELWSRYEERATKLRRAHESDPRLEDFRWRIEELRVSLFAQELKTPYPVSFKRLDKLWNAMR